MKWIVTCRAGRGDTYAPTLVGGDRLLSVPVDVPGDSRAVRSTFWRRLDEQGLDVPQVAVDLYRAAAAVFAADLRIPRSTGYDGWTRNLALHLPVSNLALWEGVDAPFTELLRFLSGDYWEVTLREATVARPAANKRLRRRAVALDSDTACLLSGGLDSFIGAADALAAGRSLYLVSHYGGGSGVHASPAQNRVAAALADKYGGSSFRHLKVNLDPPKVLTGELEPTTRSRSIVFLTLAAVVASALPAPATLLIPENGLISLNVPLTYSRLGSLSTRTTHPHTLALFQRVLDGLGIRVNVENPYQFSTKGEMLRNAVDAPLVAELTPETMSCAHPSAGRWQGGGVEHCGYCVPCIIRRASEHEAGVIGTTYTYDVRTDTLGREAAKDSRAFRIAVERATRGIGLQTVLTSGPLGTDPVKLRAYLDLYSRGIKEVGAFLSSTPKAAP
ncbi:MAG: Qat anti-phage system QueC-like protein QatC [Bacteroidota bacterium]